MNCKPGDLAVVVKSYAGNEGKIVRVLQLNKKQQLFGPNGLEYGIVWEIDPPLIGWGGVKLTKAMFDYQLRPIRDNDGEDETLTWAGKPESINA
jgi:hypothetical protein